MKKYIAPLSLIVDIHTTSVLMGSINSSSTNEETFSLGGTKTGTATSGQLSREKSGGFGSGMWEDMK